MSSRFALIAVAGLVTTGAWGQPEHPRIFITGDDLPRLRAIPQDTDVNALGCVPAQAWEQIKRRADAFIANSPFHYKTTMPGKEGGPAKMWEYTLSDERPSRHDDYDHWPAWTGMFQERADSVSTRLKHFLVAYVISEDAKYFEAAKQIVMHLCAWEGSWNDWTFGGSRSSLAMSHAAIWVGIFYDWCYETLSEQERDLIRTCLVDKALVYLDEGADKGAVYHNIPTLYSVGRGIGSIALLGEEPRAEEWIRKSVQRAAMYFDAQGEDGGALEGPMYGDYANTALADLMRALQTAGMPADLAQHRFIRTLPRYCISLLDPNSRQQACFGDGGPSQGFGWMMLGIAMAGSSEAAWYCDQIGLFTSPAPRTLITMDPDRLHPRQPDWNPSDCFVDVGYAILRDGYKADSAFMAFKCGPPIKHVGHNHFDHNSFVINFAGVWVGWDPGYRSYFDPRVRKYTVSTLGHSSVVLNFDDEYLADTRYAIPGRDQVKLAGGTIREFFTSPGFDYVLGDAAPVYNTEEETFLQRFDRQVLFAKPGVFLLRDRLQAPKPCTFTSLLHLPSGGFEIGEGDAIGHAGQADLQVHPFSPRGVKLATGVYPGAENRGPYLAVTTGRTAAAELTTVLIPRRSAELAMNPGFEDGMTGWQPRTAKGMRANHVIDTQQRHGGAASGRIDNNGYYYTQPFSLPPGAKITCCWWSKCTAAQGAHTILYHNDGSQSTGRTEGPIATQDVWRQFELTDVVPPGTRQTRLALEFFGEGSCWYDDVQITSDYEIPSSQAAQVHWLNGGSDGAAVRVDGLLHILTTGEAGKQREIEFEGHTVRTDGELAGVTFGEEEPRAFMLRGSSLRVDGSDLSPMAGTWRRGPVAAQ